jgi:hypothetical protein
MTLSVYAFRLALIVVAAALASGCSGGERTGDATTVRDSAGVVIVTSTRSQWDASAGWRVDPEPLVSIGVETGDEPYMLSRVFDALRLPDGRILIGNSGTAEIRVFDPQGTFVRSVGRRGNGPGEWGDFATVRFWRLADGSLLGYDGSNLRVHVFDSTLTYQRTVRIQSTQEGLRAFFQGVFTDGSWHMLALVPELRNEPGTYLASAQQYVRFNPDGTPGPTLRHVEGRTRFVHQFGSITHFPFVPFTAEPLAAASGDRLWVNSNGDPELTQVDLDGNVLRIARLELDRPRTADIYAGYVDASLTAMDSARRAQYEHFYGLTHPMPAHVPAFQAMLVDSNANIWLERTRMPGDSVTRWEVVDSEGAWFGTVTVPLRLRVMQVGDDFVLGRQLDSLGVERIRVHALRRQHRP